MFTPKYMWMPCLFIQEGMDVAEDVWHSKSYNVGPPNVMFVVHYPHPTMVKMTTINPGEIVVVS